jgi:hypothetical protein
MRHFLMFLDDDSSGEAAPGRLAKSRTNPWSEQELPLVCPSLASDQEHRLAAINAALPTDLTQPPWIVTKVLVFGQH